MTTLARTYLGARAAARDAAGAGAEAAFSTLDEALRALGRTP